MVADALSRRADYLVSVVLKMDAAISVSREHITSQNSASGPANEKVICQPI